MTTPHHETPEAGLPRRNMIGAGLGVLGGVAALSALSAPKAEAAALSAVYFAADPERVADSRKGIGTTQAKIGREQSRVIDLSDFLDFDIAFNYSVILNVAVTQTVGIGHLRFWQTGQPEPETSNINWFGPNQSIANLAIVGAGVTQQSISMRCDGPPAANGSTHFVIDLFGYFRGVQIPIRNGEKKTGS